MSNQNLIDVVEENIQKVESRADDIESSLNQIKSSLERMREIAVKAVDINTEENDRVQMQNEINQLSYELNQMGNVQGFEEASLLSYYGQKTACICTVAPGVDMSSVYLTGKDKRLSGDLTELIDSYIYTQNGLASGTDVKITLDTNGRVILSGHIKELFTSNDIWVNAYYMTPTVNNQNGDVTFSGYGLKFTIPYDDYIGFLSSGSNQRYVNIRTYSEFGFGSGEVYSGIPTNGCIKYNFYRNSGMSLINFTISGADNLTSFYMSGNTENSLSGLNSVHVQYTLADGTEVNDFITNYSGNLKQYVGAGNLIIRFNVSYYSYYSSYYYYLGPYFYVNLPDIYKLTRAGGKKVYKKTSKIVNMSGLNMYSLPKPEVYSLQQSQNLLDISDSTTTAEAILAIDTAIKKVDKKLDEISNLKSDEV